MQILQVRKTWRGGEAEEGRGLPARHPEGRRRPQSERERLSPRPLRCTHPKISGTGQRI